MNRELRRRLAEDAHRRHQASVKEILTKISSELHELEHDAVATSQSLQLQIRLSTILREKRSNGQLTKCEFRDVAGAITAVTHELERFPTDVLFKVYFGPRGSGFFRGVTSPAFLAACLQKGAEGFATVLPDLESGVLLDVVLDDPLHGNYFEIESW